MHKLNIITPRRLFVAIVAVLAVVITVSLLEIRSSRTSYTSRADGPDDTIDIAIAYSPMSLYRHGDTLGGLNYDIMKAMAAQYGDNVKFHPLSSVSVALDRLEKGDYDMVMADIPVTSSLRDRFRVSVPVYTDRLVLVSRDSTDLSALDLAGREVWAVEGSPSAERLENLSREIGDSIDLHLTDRYSAEQLVMLVSAGEVPCAVVNRAVALSLRPECPGLHISAEVSLSQFQAWIFRRDETALADTIDSQLERFKTSSAYSDIMCRYLSTY